MRLFCLKDIKFFFKARSSRTYSKSHKIRRWGRSEKKRKHKNMDKTQSSKEYVSVYVSLMHKKSYLRAIMMLISAYEM